MSGMESKEPADLQCKLRAFIYILLPFLAGFFYAGDHKFLLAGLLGSALLLLAVFLSRSMIKSSIGRSLILVISDLAFIGYSVYLYRNWTLFPLYLMPMSTIRHHRWPWAMGLIGVSGILNELLWLGNSEEAMYYLALHMIIAALFVTVLTTVTSLELQNARERGEINRFLSELRMAHDFLKNNNRNLTHLALTDALTELYNYRFFETSLADYFESAYRYGYSLALLMIDVDHFKNLNDTFGHRTGDTTLKTIARILQESVRKEDLVCRYGGEEFTVILPRTDLVHAADLAERVCLAVRNYEHLGIGSERVTVSIGVSAFPEEANSIQELTEFADQALYEAKRNGRDCVIARRNIYTNLSL